MRVAKAQRTSTRQWARTTLHKQHATRQWAIRYTANVNHTTQKDMSMPSFDIVSELDKQEVRNAVNQTTREVGTRYDLKDADPALVLEDDCIKISAKEPFHLQQILPLLQGRLSKRGVDLRALDAKEPVVTGSTARQEIMLRSGIESVLGKKLITRIKASKIKVQTQIMGNQLRVSGKKYDLLQEVIALLHAKDFGLPLQFVNFRD